MTVTLILSNEDLLKLYEAEMIDGESPVHTERQLRSEILRRMALPEAQPTKKENA